MSQIKITRILQQVKIIKCCGEDIYCSEFTNTCGNCGADYNWAGQRLAPREQWGEETGEHPADCVNPRLPDDWE